MHTINSIGLLLELAVLATVIWSLQSKVVFECKTANNPAARFCFSLAQNDAKYSGTANVQLNQ